MSCFLCVSSAYANFINQHSGHLPEPHLLILLMRGKMCHHGGLLGKAVKPAPFCISNLFFFFETDGVTQLAARSLLSLSESWSKNSFWTLLTATLVWSNNVSLGGICLVNPDIRKNCVKGWLHRLSPLFLEHGIQSQMFPLLNFNISFVYLNINVFISNSYTKVIFSPY